MQIELLKYFCAGATARSTAELTGVNRNTAILFFHKLREVIFAELAAAEPGHMSGEVEADESYFHGAGRASPDAALQARFLSWSSQMPELCGQPQTRVTGYASEVAGRISHAAVFTTGSLPKLPGRKHMSSVGSTTNQQGIAARNPADQRMPKMHAYGQLASPSRAELDSGVVSQEGDVLDGYPK